MKTDVKCILFRAKAKGYGVVQTDDKNQKYVLYGNKNFYFTPNDNEGGFSKKDFYTEEYIDENGEKKTTTKYNIKVTADCIKKNISNGLENMSGEVYSLGHLPSAIAMGTPFNLLRGWMVTIGGNTGYKRTGALSMQNFVQTNDSMSFLETKCSQGLVEHAKNSLHRSEVVGDMEYVSEHGAISIKNLQFLSCDPLINCAVDDNIVDLLIKQLEENFPNSNFIRDKYKMTFSNLRDVLSIDGIILDDECIKIIVKDFFKRLLSLDITKTNGNYLKLTELQYKLVSDFTEASDTDEDGWETISNVNDIEEINFTTKKFFVEISDEELAKFNEYRSKYELINKELKERQAKDKEEQKLKKTKNKSKDTIITNE